MTLGGGFLLQQRSQVRLHKRYLTMTSKRKQIIQFSHYSMKKPMKFTKVSGEVKWSRGLIMLIQSPSQEKESYIEQLKCYLQLQINSSYNKVLLGNIYEHIEESTSTIF